MKFFPLAASDTDMIIGIIAVVGWILAQIFSKEKGAPTHPKGTPQTARTPPDPTEELRKLFDELKKEEKPAPPPPLTAISPMQYNLPKEKSAHRIHEPRTETLASQKRSVYFDVEPVPFSPVKIIPELNPRSLVAPTHNSALPRLGTPLTLRKYIITNEILEKPIVLRPE